MDGLNSFYPTVEAAMDHVLNSNVKVAYFQNVDYVNSIKETHCKVQIQLGCPIFFAIFEDTLCTIYLCTFYVRFSLTYLPTQKSDILCG